jgi:uroporphyrinogen decarboxylase
MADKLEDQYPFLKKYNRRWVGTEQDIYKRWIDFKNGVLEPRTEYGEKAPFKGGKRELWQNCDRFPSAYRMLRSMMIERADTVGGEPDRVPVWCMPGTFGAKVVNKGIEEYASKWRPIAEAQLKLIEEYGMDAAVPFPDIGAVAEAWGTKTKFDSVPSTSEYVVKESKGWESLKFIKDVYWWESGRMGKVLDACYWLHGELGFSVPILGVVPSPLTLACWLGGVERVKKDMKEAPESLHKGLVDLSDAMIELVKAYFDANVMTVIMYCGHASKEVFTLDEYTMWGSRYDSWVLERCKTFMTFIGHVAGKEPFLSLAVGIYPLILLNWDMAGSNCSLGDGRKAYKAVVALSGGISPNTLVSGSASDVDAQAKSTIEMAKMDRTGFILSPGGELNYDMPKENVTAMVEAAKKYGEYPRESWKTEKWDMNWDPKKPSIYG